MKAKDRTREQKTPPGSDPRWKEWSEPVLAFLSEPRTWRAIKQWCREVGKIHIDRFRQCLAWLEDHRRVASFKDGKTLYWVSTLWQQRGPLPKEPQSESVEEEDLDTSPESDREPDSEPEIVFESDLLYETEGDAFDG